ncbi:hypothetical protein S40285_04536 [Stachybotrys chlorohalonatus IBT 40285]|uniref:Nuclear membrane fusion protein Kar5 n=1 Tax=Stachybotrys chlorohalonatus (strain IBT 40285) TaxID=1283841 RepID=A0A084QC34_STAC4|nr:hypothetical protein S40285_04536 [Stachybotrys chlorohalonata IBT 40285]
MRCFVFAMLLVWSVLLVPTLAFRGSVFSWGAARQNGRQTVSASSDRISAWSVSTRDLANEPALSETYSATLDELENLESLPLCHRVASRLLINDCQLLDGQNEATLLTDTGRAIQDFVAGYAASLAICDLERGNFHIPSACAKFREPELARLSRSSSPKLYASTLEINRCLEGLKQSDSAWITWVTYSHKTFNFCKAAREVKDKDETIHLYQRLTGILRRLTTQVEREIETRFDSLQNIFKQAHNNMEGLTPRIVRLRTDLDGMRAVLSEDMLRNAQDAAGSIKNGLNDAKSLQDLVAALINTITEKSMAMATIQESALQIASQQINNEVSNVITILATVAHSSAAMQKDIAQAHLRATELARQQDKLGENMDRLSNIADNLLESQQQHHESLELARRTTSEVLSTLATVTESATTLRLSISRAFGWGG